MGEVYLAHDNRLDRQIALKILPARFTRSADRVARFRREAKAASALNHPNIMAIYDIGEIGDTWFIAAEFIPGVTLRERLTAGKIELQEVLGIFIQCTRALDQLGHLNKSVVFGRLDKYLIRKVRPMGVIRLAERYIDFGQIAYIAYSRFDGALLDAGTHPVRFLQNS